MGVSKFTISFFVMAIAASLPNLFIGITSATQGIPELSLGDILGSNVVDLSLAVALAILFTKKGVISTQKKLIQTSALFTLVAAILPLILIHDGLLDAPDGMILIAFFCLYTYWLVSKKRRHPDKYPPEEGARVTTNLKFAITDAGKIIFGVILLALSAQGIVWSVSNMAKLAQLPLLFIGMVLVGLVSALPETYFAVISARRGETDMILGNLMGSVIIPTSVVLAIVSFIHPIVITEIPLINISRIFIIAAAILFYLFARSERKITKREGWVLLVLYIIFILTVFVSN
jgi:cation:H+ antiporter